MRLATRLLLGSAAVVGVLVAVAVVLSGRRLDDQLESLMVSQLTREARLVATQWTTTVDPDALADAAGAAVRHRVTLIDSTGRVIGDSEFSGAALAALQNHAGRPEVLEARQRGVGTARRVSPSEGDEEFYVALATPRGIVRLSLPTAEVEGIVAEARTSVLVSGFIAFWIALALAAIFSRQVTAPVIALRDVAQSLAAGDLTRRPPLAAPGEVGDLAVAVHRMAEQLGSRLNALQAEDYLLRTLVDSLQEGVIAIDARRQVLRINTSGRRLLGLQMETPFSIDLLPRDPILRDIVSEALAGHASDATEIPLGGRTLTVTARPIGGGGAVVALYDVTALRQLELMRRDFVANVSHELKTPITVINGVAETLADAGMSEEQRARFIESIRANADRMRRIVEDLLDLSRIESGGWAPDPVTVDVEAVAADTFTVYRPGATEREVELTAAIDPAARCVRADPTALRQILDNLVDNALRYTARGGTVTVFTERAQGGVWLGVRDTGVGIPAAHLSRIFERFYRVDTARSRDAGGTGLGLAIVKHLTEAHGGRVRAESVVGRGTTVAVWLPE